MFKKRYIFSVEHRKNLSLSHLNKKQSSETVAKRVIQLRGRKRPNSALSTRKVRKKISLAVKKYWMHVSKKYRKLHGEKSTANLKGKTYEEIYGKKEAKRLKKIRSISACLQIFRKVPSVYKQGWFISKKNKCKLYYQSSYELKAFKKLEKNKNIIKYGRLGFSIPYFYNKEEKNYIPDLLITYKNNKQSILEIKPEERLKEKQIVQKTNAAINFCKQNNLKFLIWTEKNLKE